MQEMENGRNLTFAHPNVQEELMDALRRSVSKEFEEYCNNATDSVLKKSRPEDLAAFSNKVWLHKTEIWCPFWMHCLRGAGNVGNSSQLNIKKTIVIIRNWLGNPAKFKGTNKDQKIYVGRSTTLHNLLFCTHTLWLNYVIVTFLLVSSSGTNHDLLCLCRVMAKKANKNIEQRILPSFLTIYLY